MQGLAREFSQADVFEISQRQRDPLGNGVLIGFLSGGRVAAVASLSSCIDNGLLNLCEGGCGLRS